MTREMDGLPKGWVKLKLGDHCETGSGGTPSRKNTSFFEGDIPWVKSGELDHNTIYDTEEKISEYALRSSSAKLVEKGTLLIALYGATVGKLAFLGVDAATNQAVCFIRTPEWIDRKYLYYFLFSFREKLLQKRIGGAQPNISQSIIREIVFPLPPLQEQHRIVSKIEELFSELDNGVANLQKARTQLKTYRQAVLKWAFEGKLTEESRKSEVGNGKGAEALLEDIREERAHRYGEELAEWEEAVRAWKRGDPPSPGFGGRRKPAKPKKPKEFPALTAGELAELEELPVGWVWVKLGNLASRIQIGPFGSQLHQKDYVSGGIPLINPKNINDQTIIPDLSVTIDLEKYNELPQYILRRDDIIMGRRGEMGRCAPITEKEDGWFCGTGSLFIRFTKFSNSVFYSHIISGHRVVRYLEDHAIGTTMKNLNSTVLNNIPVPVLSLEEQHQIVQEIESRLSVCDKLEENIAEALQKAEALRQSILQRAFAGKLVPQDPEDEPAGELLKRIRALGEEGKQLKIKL